MGPQKEPLSLISWNANGVRTKLENDRVQSLLLTYDVIGLNEVKTNCNVSFPGYVSYRSDNCDMNRGGCVVLIKGYLVSPLTPA